VKLPRDLSGEELARLLGGHGYVVTRQSGSHMRLTSTSQGSEHHVSIPRHSPLKVGTLNSVLTDVSRYLKVDKDSLSEELFG
jgi:predicted RNA binding protein YcfA (HicA-like mRNA interferase family)